MSGERLGVVGADGRTGVALIGVGRWGRRLLPELVRHFDVRVCCTTGGAEGRDWLREHFPSVGLTADLDLVLGDGAIGAVMVATPIESHALIAARALRAGKHVFVEKPLATDSARALELQVLADQGERVLFVGHVYLYHPVLARLLALTSDDPVELVRLWWRKLGTFDSDLFWNLTSHEVSLVLALMKDLPERVELLACGRAVTECDFALARLRFPGGREALIDVDRLAPTRTKVVSLLTRQGRGLTWQQSRLVELRGREVVGSHRSRGSALRRELEAFRAAIEHGRPFPSNGLHATRVVEIIAQLHAAAGMPA